MKDNKVYLRHIAEAIEKIDGYLAEFTYESFAEDDKTIDAVVRELEIIGEAAKYLSDDFKNSHAEIPFADIVSMRNRLIHEYFGVNKKIVWETCATDLKNLKRLIAPFLE